MSAAGTPSTDPWVILTRERSRYEEQFKALNPINGIVTGDQAKGFLLQSQLPALTLGQIWALADTDADGKMDINEFSIACKLINLKLRGFEIPKMLPPSLLASLRALSMPAIPPLPNASLINAPPRPEPPKVESLIGQPILQIQPIGSNLSAMGVGMHTGVVAPTSMGQPLGGMSGGFNQTFGGIPTGIVPPMQAAVPNIQPSMPPAPTMLPLQSSLPIVQPSMPSQHIIATVPPLPTQTLTGGPLISGLSNAPSAPTSLTSIPMVGMTNIASVPSTMSSAVPPSSASSGPLATSTPRASIPNLEKTASIESPQADWAVPVQTKLKYTQLFNTTDRTRSGFLSGPQARNVMVQTKLPQNILAKIWALSDMDADGRLGCEEFVLALHLCEQASFGHAPPAKLPLDLIPPSFRRSTKSLSRTASISSQGSGAQDQDAAATLLQTTFEDKRKENFDKGQAELERRRKTLLDQQRKEAEERERKEREEVDRREKARQEVERKRLEELEKQMRDQQEQERQKEEERKRQADQREAARKEMERQRQLEWEKQRLQDLQQQRQREQENVLKLKAKNQSLTIELSTLNEHVKDLSQKICDTRLGVSNVKCTIDGMRTTRDTQMQEMSQLKNRLKEQNSRLLALSQEKIKLESKNKHNAQVNGQDSDQTRVAFQNKDVIIKNLKEKISDMQAQIVGKLSDIENNNSQLNELRSQMKRLIIECESLYGVYEEKRTVVLQLKTSSKSVDYGSAWKDNTTWGSNDTTQGTEWPEDNWKTDSVSEPVEEDSIPGISKYRALYEFVARNNDEISFQPGDIIDNILQLEDIKLQACCESRDYGNVHTECFPILCRYFNGKTETHKVPTVQNAEPGWLAGQIRGHTGWFPESYVEPVDGVGIQGSKPEENIYAEIPDSKPLEGIAEVPESVSDNTEHVYDNTEQSVETEAPPDVLSKVEPEGEVEYYLSTYPYQAQEPTDLSFNANELIAVIKKDGEWWTGRLNDLVGIFPSNYVQKLNDMSNEKVEEPEPVPPKTDTSQMDNEVSQINEFNATERPLDASVISNAQIMKSKKAEIASVIAPYQATSLEQLSLARGQLIMIRKKTESGWWEGELQAKGRKRQVGWFPASYVKVLNSSGRASGRTTPVSTTRIQQEVIIDKVTALYPYTARNPDELSFAKDDIISVTAREEEAWWRGELNGVSGLFPSNYVASLQQSSIPAETLKKRQDCIKELIHTEKAYVEDLCLICSVFQKPLRESKIITYKDIDSIFLNWQDIVECNTQFLQDLTKRFNSEYDMVGDIICQHLPNMMPYIVFCSKQSDSAALLQKLTETSTAFKNFSKRCQNDSATKGMPLSSFLIKPMQRITKYPLLITKIIENTPEEHGDYIPLKEALKSAEEFLSCINENIRAKENIDRMGWLQEYVQNDTSLIFNSNTNKLGPRKLIHYGYFIKVKNGKELLGFLFNDLFILVQASKVMGSQFSFQKNCNNNYRIYKQPILIQNLTIERVSTDNIEQGTDSNRVLKVLDEETKYSILLLVPTVSECGLWTKKMEAGKDFYIKVTDFTTDKPKIKVPKGPSCGRLLVVVQKGMRFISEGKTFVDNVYCKVSLGDQEQRTDIAKDSLINGNVTQNSTPQIPNLIWNYTMQFQLKNIEEEVVTFVVYELSKYTPDVCLGRAELKVIEILRESQHINGPMTKKLILHQVESGELIVKLDLHLFK